MRYAVVNWEKISADPWILQIVQGYKLDLVEHPYQDAPLLSCESCPAEAAQVQKELDTPIEKGAILCLSPQHDQGGLYSTINLVPKKEGNFRLVINLRPLNCFIQLLHFKMEESTF